MRMQLNRPEAYVTASEEQIIAAHLDPEGKRILELGCGGAWMTRLLAERFAPASLLATEVDQAQLEKNLAIADLPRVQFRYGGAEAIDAPDASFDLVFLFKSFHHVPADRMATALREIRRVLVPGGMAYFSEPVYWGDFNDVMRLFHDEERVRRLAFETLREAVDSGHWELEKEVFFQSEGVYESWDRFEQRFIRVTHTEHDLSPALLAQVKAAFMAHMQPGGARFLKPHRVDLLRRPATG